MTQIVDDQKKSPNRKREFPAVYERGVPVAIGILLLFVVIMMVFAILVAAGVF
jgi:hypothetical protein